jgi:hypothetical protein
MGWTYAEVLALDSDVYTVLVELLATTPTEPTWP